VGKSILLVDDEQNCLEGLRRILHRFCPGWVMCSTHSVDAALERIAGAAFDAIVSDIRMPGKDGFELLRILKSTPKTRDIPVVILTGSGETTFKGKALEMGAADLLNKPVCAEDLLARLRNVLRLKEFQDELKQQNETLDRKVKERTAELEASRRDVIWRLGLAAEYRNEETGRHILRVGLFSRILAEEVGMTADYVETILLASPLHDIGKIGIPDAILLKPGSLDEEEWAIMKNHCQIGSSLLCDTPELSIEFRSEYSDNAGGVSTDNPIMRMAGEIALTHHERWDGSGYPHHLVGEAIPLSGRIVGLMDVYDALRSERPYKPSFSEDASVEMIREQAGRQFDPMLCAAFEKRQEQIRVIFERYSNRTTVPAGN